MFHLISWSVVKYSDSSYISNEYFGIEANYQGQKTKGLFFLFPLLDDHAKTMYYFAWDAQEQKDVFAKLLKISWIGPKTAFFISNSDYKELTQAVESMNIAFFQKLPWVWPKTAKRLVIELKSVVKSDDLVKINGDDKSIRDIIKYCKGLGYDQDTVKTTLWEYQWEISKKTTAEVVKWLVGKL